MRNDAKFLSRNEKNALEAIKQRVSAVFEIRQYVLFGSKARGDAAPDSDIDLLIVTARALEHAERHRISDILTDVNLEYDTLFSFIAVDEETWNSRLHRFYPIHVNVEREGIPV